MARAVEYAAAVARNEQGPLPLVRHRSLRQGEDTVAVLARARDRAVQLGPVAVAAVEATAGGVEAADFDVGMNRAREIYDSLSGSDELRRQRDRFLSRPPGDRSDEIAR